MCLRIGAAMAETMIDYTPMTPEMEAEVKALPGDVRQMLERSIAVFAEVIPWAEYPIRQILTGLTMTSYLSGQINAEP